MYQDQALSLVNRCFRIAQRNIRRDDVACRFDVAQWLIEAFEAEGVEFPTVHRLRDMSWIEREIIDAYLSRHPDPTCPYVASRDCYRCRCDETAHTGNLTIKKRRCLREGCRCDDFVPLAGVGIDAERRWLEERYPPRDGVGLFVYPPAPRCDVKASAMAEETVAAKPDPAQLTMFGVGLDVDLGERLDEFEAAIREHHKVTLAAEGASFDRIDSALNRLRQATASVYRRGADNQFSSLVHRFESAVRHHQAALTITAVSTSKSTRNLEDWVRFSREAILANGDPHEGLDEEIRGIEKERVDAIAEQDFERAARLRHVLEKKREPRDPVKFIDLDALPTPPGCCDHCHSPLPCNRMECYVLTERDAKRAAEAQERALADEHPVAASIRREIRAILAGPLTIASATRIERVLGSAVPLLQALSPGADWLPKTRRQDADDPDHEAGSGFVPPGAFSPYAQSPPPETLGTRALREVLAALPQLFAMQRQGPDALVKAIIAAEAGGNAELAKQLREKLLES